MLPDGRAWVSQGSQVRAWEAHFAGGRWEGDRVQGCEWHMGVERAEESGCRGHRPD